jgi:transcriptional regulator with XRE-family HTH domain
MPDRHRKERKAIADLLKEAREYLALSQDEVARAMKLPRSAISQIETGQRKVDALELKNFAHLYRRPVTYFTGEFEPREPEEVHHLARAAAKLSSRDRAELLRFAEFLQSRSSRKEAEE